jgi:4-amino-4-deoxy-L-arabinose transferase-like glycosyltransferase
MRVRGSSAIGLRAILGRLPAVAWMCASIAVLNGVAWSIITPPFQGRDEPDHFAYVQQLAQTRTLPRSVASTSSRFSPEEELVLSELDYAGVRLKPQIAAISSVAEQQALTRAIKSGVSQTGSGDAGVATSEPPLFYAIETVPYAIGQGNILTQLELMRLLGALMAGVTVLMIFLFLRELLPGAPWAATAGALCVALQPLFGFMSGSLNPDTMLYAVSAAVFYCLARGFRRGFTRHLAVAIGLLSAVGFSTKLNFIGLGLGVFLGLILLSVREARSKGRAAYLSFAIAVGIGSIPVVLYALANLLSGHPTLGIASGSISSFLKGQIFHEISYVWQLYLPRLPGMTHYFRGMTTYWDIWFERSVGLYGAIDTMFPGWVSRVALVPAIAIALLCGRMLVVRRAALRNRLPEFAVYTVMAIGVLVMVGVASYNADVLSQIEAYGDPRYLLPILPLFGAVLTLAVRGAGRRWAPATAAVLVILFLSHDVFSQLQVIGRYYG